MRRFFLFLLLGLSLFIFGCDALAPEDEPAVAVTTPPTAAVRSQEIAPVDIDLSEFEAFVEESLARDNIPGVAVAVVRGSEPLLLKGFGWRDVAQQQPVTPDTLFHIGSTHKSLTALLVATLVDDGVVDWDTPVIEIYPDFELADETATEEVTLRHLLSMSSGIAAEAEDDFDIDNAQAEDVLPFLAEAPLLGKPGEVFSYSNLSLAAAGYLAVLATSPDSDDLYGDYAELLAERVLRPIGMTSAVIRASDAEASPDYGRSYVLDGAGRPEPAEPEDWDGDPLAPSGSLKASAREMALYISTQLQQGEAPNGNRVVSANALAETWQPRLENYGMGWETSRPNGVTLISHEGSFDNYLSVIGLLPAYDLGFVILTNSEEAAGEFIEQAPLFLVELVAE